MTARLCLLPRGGKEEIAWCDAAQPLPSVGFTFWVDERVLPRRHLKREVILVAPVHRPLRAALPHALRPLDQFESGRL